MVVRKTLITLVAVAMLSVTSVVSAVAAQGKQVEVITSGYTSNPALVNNPSLVFKALDRGVSPAALGATTNATEPLRVLSPQQVQQEALKSKNYEVTPLDKYAMNMPSIANPPYDYTNLAECKAHHNQSGSVGGWVKNHFAYCHRDLAWARAKKCGKLGCQDIGDVQIVVTLIGYGKMGPLPGSKTERYMEFGMSLDNVKAEGPWTQSDATWNISMQCKGSPSPSSCRPGAFNGGKKSIADWSKNRSTKFQIVSPGKAAGKANGEQIAFGFFQTTSQFSVPGMKIDPTKAIGDQNIVRFDSAWYTFYKQGSVFTQLIPFIVFSTAAKSGYQAASQHILLAFSVASTVPPFPDKPLYLPGGNYRNPYQLPTDTSNPLHRLYPGLSAANLVRYNSNNDFASRACDIYFPGWRKKKGADGRSYNQCDEYPFRSTYEGAARFKTDGKKYQNLFSAMPIPARQNTDAGSMLGVWYGYDRILNGDFFFIRLAK